MDGVLGVTVSTYDTSDHANWQRPNALVTAITADLISRMHFIATLVLAAVASSATHSRAIDDSLRTLIERRIAQVSGAEVGVAFRDLSSPDTLYLTADARFHAASTMKVPVMIELFRQVDRRRLGLDQRITV